MEGVNRRYSGDWPKVRPYVAAYLGIGRLHILTLAAVIGLGAILHGTAESASCNPAWSTKANMLVGRFEVGAAAVGGTVYVMGGSSGSTNQAYDPATNTWTYMTSVPTPRYALAVVSVGGLVYAIGGMGSGSIVQDTVEAYNPVTDSWTTKAPMKSPRWVLAAAVVGGTIYAVGGSSSTTMEAYDTATNTWTVMPPMATPRSNLAATALGGTVYAISGMNGGNIVPTVEAFDTNTKTWTTKANVLTARYSPAAATVNGIAYVIGGGGATGLNPPYYAGLEYYDPAADSWTWCGNMPTGREFFGAAVIGGTIYAAGGWTGAAAKNAEAGMMPHASVISSCAVQSTRPVIGEWINVVGTVTNGGTSDFGSAIPSLQWNLGGSLLEQQGGVTPATPQNVGAGGSRTFTWTLSVSGAGTVNYTVTINGIDVCSATSLATSTSCSFDTFQMKTALDAPPSPGFIGQWIRVSLSVTNNGANKVTGVTPEIRLNRGASYVDAINGPLPAGPLDLLPGGTETFVWTYSLSGIGNLQLTVTVMGIDADSGLLDLSARTYSMNILAGGRLSAGMSTNPPSVKPGNWFSVHCTVTNTGSANATGVLPSLQVNTGGSIAEQIDGPNPATPQVITPGTSATFSWTFSASGNGSASFTATAGGTDSGTGNPILSNGADCAETMSSLVGALSIGNSAVLVGQWTTLFLTVTNEGSSEIDGVSAEIQPNMGSPLAALKAGPEPSSPQVLPPGGSVTFSWSYSVSGMGLFLFTASATGTDSVSAGPAVVNASRYFAVILPNCGFLPGFITTVAGTGTPGYNVDGVLATSAQINAPYGLTVDGEGNIYIGDYNNHRVRKVSAATGFISTVAGTGTGGYNGDNILATKAQLWFPTGVQVDTGGNLYIEDGWNQRVRRVDAASGKITTVAGTGQSGWTGDNVPATTSRVWYPGWGALDSAGNLYFSDIYNSRIRRVDRVTGIITTVAGNGQSGYNADNIAATSAKLNSPAGVAFDQSGNMYIGDQGNNRIRRVDAVTKVITTVAGTGSAGYNEDSIPAVAAKLNGPNGVVVDGGGNLYIGDWSNNRVRRVDAATGLISTIAGNGQATYNGDHMVATGVQLNNTVGVAVDSSCRVYVSELAGVRIRRIDQALLAPFVTVSPVPSLVGRWITVALTLTNTGSNDMTGLTSAIQLNTGAGLLELPSGPEPPGPMTLSAGSSTTFMWTYSISGAGTVDFTVTALGVDSGSGWNYIAGYPGRMNFLTGGKVAAAIAFIPGTVKPGAPFKLRLTVTNTGGEDATGVVPALQMNTGASLVAMVTGPLPPGPVTLAPGTATVFEWTFSSTLTGTVEFTCTASGVDAGLGEPTVSAVTKTFAVVESAKLVASMTMTPPSGCVGQLITVALTITNTGGVAVVSGDSGIGIGMYSAPLSYVSGPTVSYPITFPPGSAVTIMWTYQVAGTGQAHLYGSGWGYEQGFGGWLASNAVFVDGLFGNSAQLAATLIAPAHVSDGQWFNVLLSTRNTGDAPAVNLSASQTVTGGASMVSAESGPVPPGPVSISGQGSQVFSWTYSANGVGMVEFSTTASGMDSCTSADRTVSLLGQTEVVRRASLEVALAAFPASVKQGRIVEVRLTATNTGEADVVGAVPSPTAGAAPAGRMAMLSGPHPAGPLVIEGGTARTFTWTYRGVTVGAAGFAAGAGGADENAGWPVVVTAGPVGITVTAAAYLVSSLVSDITSVNPGATFRVAMTVTNEGDLAANAVTATLTPDDKSVLEVISGPVTTAGNDVAPGGSKTFTWTARILRAGKTAFTAEARGSDAGDGSPVSTRQAGTVTSEDRFTEEIVVFPNPASGDQFNVALKLGGKAREIQVDIFNTAFQRIYGGTWRDVEQWDGILVVSGILRWAPGVYIVQARATLADGQKKSFPIGKLVIKR